MAGAVRCELIYSLDDQPWAMNVFHLDDGPGTFDQSYADALADVLSAANLTAGLQDNLPSEVEARLVRVQEANVSNGPQFAADPFIEGADGAQLLATNVSLCVTLQTEPGGVNGRIFQWGASELRNTSNGRPSLGYIGAVLQFWDEVRIATTGHAVLGPLSVFSRSRSNFYHVTGIRRSGSSAALGWQTQARRRDGLALGS